MLKNRILKICIATVLLLAMLTGVCSCAATQPPEEKLESAYKKYVDTVVESINVYYDNSDKHTVQNTSIDLDIGVELSSTLLTLLTSSTEQNWEWINDATIHLSENMSDNKLNIGAALGFKDKQLISANAIMDMASGDLYAAIPLLTAKYLKVNMSEETGTDLPSVIDGLDFGKVLPEKKVMTDLIYKYFDIVMQNLTEVEKVDATITAAGVVEECSALELTLTQLQVADILVDVLTEVKQDNDIKNIIYSAVEYGNEIIRETQGDAYVVSPAETHAEFVEECNDLIQDTNESIADGDISDVPMITLKNFVTPKNDIMGIDIQFTFDGDSLHIFAGTADDGKDVGLEIYVDDYNGPKLFQFTGKTTEDKNVISGSYELLVNGGSMLFIDFENIDTKRLEQGYLNGSITLSPSSDLISLLQDEIGVDAAVAGAALSSMSLKIDFEQQSDKQLKTVLHVMSGRNDYLTITIDGTVTEGSTVSIPTDFTESADVWANDFDFSALLTAVSESGLPDNIVQLIQTYIMILQWS